MHETANILQWPVDVIRAVNESLDLAIAEERDAAIAREGLIRDTVDPSQGLLDLWLTAVDKSKIRLQSLFEAKTAVLGALRIVEKDMKVIMN